MQSPYACAICAILACMQYVVGGAGLGYARARSRILKYGCLAKLTENSNTFTTKYQPDCVCRYGKSAKGSLELHEGEKSTKKIWRFNADLAAEYTKIQMEKEIECLFPHIQKKGLKLKLYHCVRRTRW